MKQLMIVGLLVLTPLLARGLARSARAAQVSVPTWALLAAAPLIPLVGLPILIHRTHRLALEPTFEPFDPEGPEAPEELREHFADTADQLEPLGFAPELTLRTRGSTPNADGFVSLYWNPSTREAARVLAVIGQSDAIRNVAAFVVFITEFADGTEVVSSNRSSPRTFPPRRPPYHGATFPQVRDAGHLLVLHRAFVDRFADGRVRVDPVTADPFGYILQKDFARPLAHHVACGYAYDDEPAGVQRLTWKGAALSTWKLLPPFKQVGLARERLRGARLIAALGREQAAREFG